MIDLMRTLLHRVILAIVGVVVACLAIGILGHSPKLTPPAPTAPISSSTSQAPMTVAQLAQLAASYSARTTASKP